MDIASFFLSIIGAGLGGAAIMILWNMHPDSGVAEINIRYLQQDVKGLRDELADLQADMKDLHQFTASLEIDLEALLADPFEEEVVVSDQAVS